MAKMTERTMRLHDVAAVMAAMVSVAVWASVGQTGASPEAFMRGLKEGAIIIVPLLVAVEFLYDRLGMGSRGEDKARLSDNGLRGPAVISWVFHGVCALLGIIALRAWPENASIVGLAFATVVGAALGRWAVAEVALRRRAGASSRSVKG